ncbi:hypothetical protein [Salipiger bermudensis]|uniref:hypothetical protein n=1 Tax=Salipiger bermudensis TaxID=344736 RepID=UPI001CD28A74|nr:hypothetical protein [Salipiger bermudensis]MCA1284018.1 hypothetical protein [Salipiger bermudensis]
MRTSPAHAINVAEKYAEKLIVFPLIKPRHPNDSSGSHLTQLKSMDPEPITALPRIGKPPIGVLGGAN